MTLSQRRGRWTGHPPIPPSGEAMGRGGEGRGGGGEGRGGGGGGGGGGEGRGGGRGEEGRGGERRGGVCVPVNRAGEFPPPPSRLKPSSCRPGLSDITNRPAPLAARGRPDSKGGVAKSVGVAKQRTFVLSHAPMNTSSLASKGRGRSKVRELVM